MSPLSPSATGIELRDAESAAPVVVRPRRLVVAGYTGRDGEHVNAHIRELEKMGIAPPASVPAFYELPVDLLACSESISVGSPESSGEVEAVLVGAEGRWWVGIGSDHTARDVERESIRMSKQACPKVIGREVLAYDRLRDGWDDVEVRSWVRTGDGDVPYQDGKLSDLLPIPSLLGSLVSLQPSQLEGLVVFLGTVPLLTDGFVFADGYRMELVAPALETRLTLTYDIRMEESS